MLTLALDTSTSHGSVAVFRDDALLSQREWHITASHSEVLTQAIDDCLKEANCKIADIDLYAVDHGPGSFTGLRVAVSCVRALAYAFQKPIVALNACEIIAGAFSMAKLTPPLSTPVVIVLNAHRNQFYIAFVTATNEGSCVSQIETLTGEQLDQRLQAPHLCVGDGYAELIGSAVEKKLHRDSRLIDYPRAETLARLISRGEKMDSTYDWKSLQPLYIRASGAEEKIREGQAK